MLVQLSKLGNHLPDLLFRNGEFIATGNETQGKVDHYVMPTYDKLFLQAECGLVMSCFVLVLLNQSQVQVVACLLILYHISNVNLKVLLGRIVKT